MTGMQTHAAGGFDHEELDLLVPPDPFPCENKHR
jgi:hypothetical protein